MCAGVVPQVHQVALYAVAVALGVGVHYSIMFGLATLAIWIMRAQGLIYGYFNVFNIFICLSQLVSNKYSINFVVLHVWKIVWRIIIVHNSNR